MFISSLKMHHQLTKQQKQFIRKDGVSDELSIPQWIKLLEPLCKYDEQTDPLRKKLLTYTILSFFLMFFSVFASVFLGTLWPLLIMFCSTIILKILHSIYKRSDINNNVRSVIFPLLQMLSLEVGNKQKVKMHINFRKKLARKDVSNVVKGNGKSVFYRYEVLKIETDLVDKSRLSINVVDTVLKRTRSNGRKTKTKIKLKRVIELQMTFAKLHYQLNKKRVPKEVKIKESDDKIAFKQKFKQAAQGSVAIINLEPLLDAAHLSYSYLEQKENS
jgi:hypothetical protein